MIVGQRIYSPMTDVLAGDPDAIVIIPDTVTVGSDDLYAGDPPDEVGLGTGDQTVTLNATAENLNADTIVLNDGVDLDSDAYLVRIGVYLAGTETSAASQTVRGVIYTTDGTLVAAGDSVPLESDADPGWITLAFSAHDGLRLPAGGYRYGMHAGAVSAAAELYTADGVAGDLLTVPDVPFTAGAPATLPAGAATGVPAVMFLELLAGVVIPADVTDDYLATLPFDITQQIFGQSAPIASTRASATAGWYGTTFDPTSGANAIVRTGGPLVGLVGERILITRRNSLTPRSVAVYVHNELPFPDEIADEDLVLTARAFLALGSQALDDLQVDVTVLS